MATTMTAFKTLLATYPHTRGIKEGRIAPPDVKFEFTELEPVNTGFNRMADHQEFDISEMALTTYILARAYEKPITALPIVVNRGFHHGRIVYNVNSGIREPKDLEGRTVGLRSYTQTVPLWVRGVLVSEYGVDLDKINWVAFEPPHVRAFQNPPNVRMASEDESLDAMVESGELDAAIGPAGLESPNIRPLFQDPAREQVEWFKRTGVYPVNHVITMTNEFAARHADLIRPIYDCFKAAKQEYLDHLQRGENLTKEDQAMVKRAELVGGDPYPYGMSANRTALDYAAQSAFEQRISKKRYTIDNLFGPIARELD